MVVATAYGKTIKNETGTKSAALMPTTKDTTPTPASTEPTPVLETIPTPSIDPYAGRCVITINSQKYDVTDFRTKHPGGDVFNCGTNMTSIFYGQHDDKILKQMEKYKIK